MDASRLARRPVARWIALGFALLAAACMHWAGTSPPYQHQLHAQERHRVRVYLTDGSQMNLDSARVEGDSLIGVARVSGGTGGAGPGAFQRTSIPLSGIQRLEIRKANVGGTVLLATGGALVVGAIVAAAIIGNELSNQQYQTCPLAYSWDGEAWRLDSGTFGGLIMAPLAGPRVDQLAHLRPAGGEARVRLSSELDETDRIDAAELLTVDHPAGRTVAPDEAGRVRGLRAPVPPVAARDDRGRDVLALVSSRDEKSWTSDPRGRDTARASDLRSGVELAFVRPEGAIEARLVVDGRNTTWAAALMAAYVALHGREAEAWYDSVNADPDRARRYAEIMARTAFLRAEVETPDGWVMAGAVRQTGPEVEREQVVPLDLARVRGDTVHVRLASVPSFWWLDRVAMDFGPEPELSVRTVAADRATDQDGRDVLGLLASADGHAFVGERGDRVDLVFPLPPVPADATRSYLLKTTGWYRLHVAAVGEPDTAAIRRIDGDPGFAPKYAVSRMNAVLSLLASKRP